jgi:hypothetical protein
MEIVRPALFLTRLATYRRDAIEQFLEWHAVVDVGARQDKASRMPFRSVIRRRFMPGLP